MISEPNRDEEKLATDNLNAYSDGAASDEHSLRLGELMRASAVFDLPESDESLRDAVMEKLNDVSMSSKAVPEEQRNRKSWGLALCGLAALILLGVGLFQLSFVQSFALNRTKVELNGSIMTEARMSKGEMVSASANPNVLSESQVITEQTADLQGQDGSVAELDVLSVAPIGPDHPSRAGQTPAVQFNVQVNANSSNGSVPQSPNSKNVMVDAIRLSEANSKATAPVATTPVDPKAVFETRLGYIQSGGQALGDPAVDFAQAQKQVEMMRAMKQAKQKTSFGRFYNGVKSEQLAAVVVPNTADYGETGWVGGVEIRSGKDGVERYGDVAGGENSDGQPDGDAAQMMKMMQQLAGRARNEQYDPIIENKFIEVVLDQAVSTFSSDVDTASYSNMRRFLSRGQRPPANSIRIEEWVNYFQYDYPQPKDDVPFGVSLETAECPWQPGHRLVRIGVKGKEVHRKERPASNLVFLLDVSGSMKDRDKLPLLQRGLVMMLNELDENDRISIVTYASNAGVRLQPTSGDQKMKIRDVIEGLNADGSTNGSAGIEKAYALAAANFVENGTNRVVLATDGDLNVGTTDDESLVKLIKQKAAEKVFLTVLGFGTGNLKDSKLEKLADNGNGSYAYIDSMREARRVLVEQMSGSLVTIAKDVKFQVEFNPAEVAAYRLLGYENRKMANADFRNPKKDAGDIGAGHCVTALYEIVPSKLEARKALSAKLKYQVPEPVKPQPKNNLSDAANSGEMLTLAIRYKDVETDEEDELEFSLSDSNKKFYEASNDFRFAASVASFGMLLRGSKYRGDADLNKVEKMASDSLGEDPSGYRAEFVDLIRKASGAFRR